MITCSCRTQCALIQLRKTVPHRHINRRWYSYSFVIVLVDPRPQAIYAFILISQRPLKTRISRSTQNRWISSTVISLSYLWPKN